MNEDKRMVESGVNNNEVSLAIEESAKGAFFSWFVSDEQERNAEVCMTKELFCVIDSLDIKQPIISEVKIKLSADEKGEGQTDLANSVILSRKEMNALNLLIADFGKLKNDTMGDTIERCMQNYFEVLVLFLEGANKVVQNSPYRFAGYKRLLEELLFMNSFRTKGNNEYILSEFHPIVLMNDYLEKLNNNLIFENAYASTEQQILSTIVETKNKNRKHFKIYAPNKVLEVGERSNDFYNVESFEVRENSTEIPAIRLWEKIQSYKKNHDVHQKEINIACFGQLQDVERLKTLCAEDNIKISFFKRNVGIGEYYFINRNCNCINEVYDLLNASDVDALFDKYQIVLFMDMNCFYRQYQHEKSIDEKNEVANCKWYMERAKQFDGFKDKAMVYQLIYNHVGMWLNSYNTELSPTYEFDPKLYFSLLTAYRPKTDVYLYIKYGSKIAGNSLRYSNVCNDEAYDGADLIVYKYGQETDINERCKKFLERDIDYTTRINFWKILKSINNQYCEAILQELAESTENEDIVEVIRNCKETHIILNYRKINSDGERQLSYYVQTNGGVGRLKEKAKEIIEVVLKHALGMGDVICVRRIFRQLITNSIVSNAQDISDLLFAHLIAMGKLNSINCVEELNNPEQKPPRENADFKAKRSCYSVMVKLAGLRIRSIEDRTGYFVYTVRKEVCPEIEEDVFREILAKITECCEAFGYTESLLYSNSKLD